MLAPYGSFMSRDTELDELSLGILVVSRPWNRRTRWGRMLSTAEGAHQVRDAFRALSSFVQVKMMNEPGMLPRPFAVAFQEL